MISKIHGRPSLASAARGTNLGFQILLTLCGVLACSEGPDGGDDAPRRSKNATEQREIEDARGSEADGGARLPAADAGAAPPFDDEEARRTSPPALGDGDVELGFRCDGTATCHFTTDEKEEYPLKVRDGRCYLADITLNGDGTILEGQFPTTWGPTESGVEFCADGECLPCTIDERVIITEPHCGGSAPSCSSRVAGECVDGCDFRSRVVPDIFSGGTYSEFYCTGDVDPCSSYENQLGCDHAMGCKWYDGKEPVVETSLEDDLAGVDPLPPHVPGYDLTYGLSKLTDFVSLSKTSSCGIRKDGSVMCWENTFPGYAVAINGIEGATAIAGECAVLFNGRVACWNWRGHAGLVEPLLDAVSIEASDDDVCAIRETGAVLCWRVDHSDEKPTFVNFNEFVPFGAKRVALGGEHTCVVLADERLVCFRGNESCELGLGTCNTHYVPFLEAEAEEGPSAALDLPLRDIDARYQHTCATQNNGTVKCWGNREPLGYGLGATSKPVELKDLEDVVELSDAYEIMYALKSDGTVWAYDGPSGGEVRQLSGLKNVVAVSENDCALLESGEVLCWDRDWALQLVTEAEGAAAPWPVWTVPGPSPLPSNDLDFGEAKAPLERVVQVALGSEGSCGVSNDGSVVCWGTEPAQAKLAGESVKQLAAGDVSVALLGDGTLRCWGNGKPLLGERADAPVPCWTKERFDAISVGWGVVCGTQAGVLECDTDWTDSDTLAFDRGLNDAPAPVEDFAAGSDAATVLVEGKVYAAGQRRNSNNNPVFYPYREVTGLPEATAVSADCALGVDGLVYCWELEQARAEPIEGLRDVVQFAARGTDGCALTSAGAVYCWGSNESGQCSVTHTYGDVSPTRVELPEPAVEVDYDSWSACARLESGRVACWGFSPGVGTSGSNPHPQVVLEQ